MIRSSGLTAASNGGQTVLAMLFCGAPGAGGSLGNATAHISDPAGVPLDVNGDVQIDDVLTPAPPSPCDSPALLIATPGTHHWFAAGIPKADDLKP
jgi:hypothetical protein